jgi:hypothetical protein
MGREEELKEFYFFLPVVSLCHFKNKINCSILRAGSLAEEPTGLH